MISNPQENSEISNVSCVESDSLSSLSGQQQGTNTSQGEEKMAIGQNRMLVHVQRKFHQDPSFLFRSPVYPTHCVLWSWHSWTRTCLTFDLGFTFLSTMPLTPGQNYQQRSPKGSPLSPLATPSFGKLWRWVSMSETIVYCKPTLETPTWAS